MASPLVTLITATGGRQEAFSLCERYMERQTWQGQAQWIIVDDCRPATTLNTQTRFKKEYYRGPKDWRQGINTQRPNMDEALKHVKGDYIFVVEDDDWYAPNYIEYFMKLLQIWDIVGEGNAKYYNIVERCWKEWGNWQTASLCQTALHKKHLDVLDEAVNSAEGVFIDIPFWRRSAIKGLHPVIVIGTDHVVGIKGMPGKFGIGAGHHPQDQHFVNDPGFAKLRELVGEDWLVYKDIVSKMVRKIPAKPPVR